MERFFIFLQNMKPWTLLHVEVELCILMMLIWQGVIKKGTALPFAALKTINPFPLKGFALRKAEASA